MEQMEFEQMEHREVQREAVIYQVLRHTMSAIAERGLRYLALIVTAILLGWAAYDPNPTRMIVAGMSAAMLYWPSLFKKGGGDAN